MQDVSEVSRAWMGMTELEEAMRGPDGADVVGNALERLSNCERTLNCAIDKGISPVECESVHSLKRALLRAREIVSRYYEVVR